MSPVKPPVLRVEHLTMRFGGLVAIDDLSFQAARGDITALIGPNGAGKTTVFNCITGFYKPTEGRIALAHGDGAIWDEIETLTDRGTRSLAHGGEALLAGVSMPLLRLEIRHCDLGPDAVRGLAASAELADGWLDLWTLGPAPKWQHAARFARIVTTRSDTGDRLLPVRARRVCVMADHQIAVQVDSDPAPDHPGGHRI